MLAALLLLLLPVAHAATHATHDPVAAVRGLITRVLGAPVLAHFQLETIPADPASGLDVFEMDSSGALVVLRGNTGSSLAAALNKCVQLASGKALCT